MSIAKYRKKSKQKPHTNGFEKIKQNSTEESKDSQLERKEIINFENATINDIKKLTEYLERHFIPEISNNKNPLILKMPERFLRNTPKLPEVPILT